MTDLLTADEAERLVDSYMENADVSRPTQQMLDDGEAPRLKGYVVKPGKVSDSIFGGTGSFTVDADKEPVYGSLSESRLTDKTYFEVTEDGKTKRKVTISFENSPFDTPDGTPVRSMVRTKRISTHDILRGEIPFKDQALAMNHNFMRKVLSFAIGTSQYETSLPDNSVVIAAENLRQIAFENVLRAYMARSTTSTSLYVHYMNGEREFCGHHLPEGLYPNCGLPYVMDTPSTKSDEHDESVSPQQLFDMGVCTPEQYAAIRDGSMNAFYTVSDFLKSRGVIAVDTKTEHGINRKGEIVSQDEIWTMDSSRFWLADDYNTQRDLFNHAEPGDLRRHLEETQPGIKEKDFLYNNMVGMCPISYSKEFARGFSIGKEGYTDEQARQIAIRYIEGLQNLIGVRFEPDMRPYEQRVIEGLNTVVRELSL